MMDPECSRESERLLDESNKLLLAHSKREPCAKGANPEYPCTKYPCWPCADFKVVVQRALNDAYKRGEKARMEYEEQKRREGA